MAALRIQRTLWWFAVLLVFLLSLGMGILICVPKLRVQLLGFCRSEPFVEGMPSSYWIHELGISFDVERAKLASSALRAGGVSSVNILVEALASPSDEARRQSAMLLAELGPNAEPAVPALIREALRNCPVSSKESGTVRVRMYESIEGKLQRQSAERSAAAAVIALIRIGNQAISPLLKSLEDTTYEREAAVARILAGICERSPDDLRSLISHSKILDNPRFNRELVQVLSEDSWNGRIPTQSLIEALLSGSVDFRQWAIQELSDESDWNGPVSPEILTQLIAELGDKEVHVALAAARILVRLGEQSVGALFLAFLSGTSESKKRVFDVLMEIGPQDITTLLKEADAQTKREVLELIPWRARAGTGAVSILRGLLRDDLTDVRNSALEKMASMEWDDDSPIEELLDLFPGSDEQSCNLLAECLLKARGHSSEVSGRMLHFFKDERSWVRFHAALSLCRMSSCQHGEMRVVIEVLESNPEYLRPGVLEVLSNHGLVAKPATNLLLRRLETELGTREQPRRIDLVLTGDILRTLRKIECDSPEVIPVLINLLDIEGLPGSFYANALQLLAQLASHAKPQLVNRLASATDRRIGRNIVFGLGSGAGDLKKFYSEILESVDPEFVKRLDSLP